MTDNIQRPAAVDLNAMLHTSAEELNACQENLSKNVKGSVEGGIFQRVVPSDQRELIDHLMDTLEDTNMHLTKEIISNRVLRIEPEILKEIDLAIEMAMDLPTTIDVKVSEIYMSIFGWNTPLWHTLREMQRLLRTVDVLKDTRGKRVAKVDKKKKELRKRRNEPN